MKKIGMIGGLSWVSTADYYKLLNLKIQKILGGVTSAHLILESVNRQEYVDFVIKKRDEEAACQILVNAAHAVEKGGADFIIFTCNDVHRFAPAVQEKISVPLLHIAECVGKRITDSGLSSVSLLGVKKTMESEFYPEILSSLGIKTIIPSEGQRKIIHDRIYEELVNDVFLEGTRNEFLAIIDELQREGAQGSILGCTEIPLLLNETHTDVPLFSTTEIHCEAAVAMALLNGAIGA